MNDKHSSSPTEASAATGNDALWLAWWQALVVFDWRQVA